MVVGQAQLGWDAGNAGVGRTSQRLEFVECEHVEMGDREHPPAIIACRIVEHVQLLRLSSRYRSLLPQRTAHRSNERLAFVKEGPRQCPLRFDRTADEQHA